MATKVTWVDAPPAGLRLAVERDAAGEVVSVDVTVFEQDGARRAFLDAAGAREVEAAICAPDRSGSA